MQDLSKASPRVAPVSLHSTSSLEGVSLLSTAKNEVEMVSYLDQQKSGFLGRVLSRVDPIQSGNTKAKGKEKAGYNGTRKARAD